jgi:hypothetical protein
LVEEPITFKRRGRKLGNKIPKFKWFSAATDGSIDLSDIEQVDVSFLRVDLDINITMECGAAMQIKENTTQLDFYDDEMKVLQRLKTPKPKYNIGWTSEEWSYKNAWKYP